MGYDENQRTGISWPPSLKDSCRRIEECQDEKCDLVLPLARQGENLEGAVAWWKGWGSGATFNHKLP